MLDSFERRVGGNNYWSAIINPALMSFNDFSNFYMYHRNMAAMQHYHQQQQHQQHQELMRQHFGGCFSDNKKRQRCDSESPKPKRQKVSDQQQQNSGKSLKPMSNRPVAGSAVRLENPEDLRAETITPNSNKSGLITFRPHSDILTSCLETKGNCSKTQQQRKKIENGELRKVDGHIRTLMLSSHLSKNSLSNLLSRPLESREEGEGAISRLFPEILSIIFQYLDITSKGRVAQVKILFSL